MNVSLAALAAGRRGPLRRARSRRSTFAGLAGLGALAALVPLGVAPALRLGANRAGALTPASPPGPPTIDSVSSGNASVTVTWTAPSDDGGSPITSYQVSAFLCSSTCSSTFWADTIAGASATSTAVSGLVNGDTYVVTVIASNTAGAGPASADSQPVTPLGPPGAPTPWSPPDYPGNGSVAITWLAPANDGGSPITSYTVYVYPAADCVASVCSGTPDFTVSAPASSTGVTVYGLSNGDEYGFTVTATNAIGEGPPYAALLARPAAQAGAPDAPTNVVASPGPGSATLTWTAAVTNGIPVTQYYVEAFPAAQCTTVCQGEYAGYWWTTATTLTVSLQVGVPYVFIVTAETPETSCPTCSSPASSVSNVVTPTAFPPLPTGGGTGGGGTGGGGGSAPPTSTTTTTTTLAVTTTTQPPPPPSVSFVRVGAVRNAVVVLTLSCAHQACRGVVQLSRATRPAARHGTPGVARARLQAVASTRYRLLAGQTGSSTLRLSTSANAALLAAPRRSLALVLRATVAHGRSLQRAVVLHAGARAAPAGRSDRPAATQRQIGGERSSPR